MTLYLAWPFANATYAHFSIPALERKVLRDAIAAEHLHTAIHDASTGFGGDKFCHGRFLTKRLASLGAIGGFQRQPPRLFDVDLVVDEHPLDRLTRR